MVQQIMPLWVRRNRRAIGIGGAIVLLFLGLVWVSRPDAQSRTPVASGAPGAFVAEEQSYDFGTISMAAGKVTHDFRIRNTGGAPVTIRRMSTSCMCTSASLAVGDRRYGPFGMPGHAAIPRIDVEIPPGATATIPVTFDPAAHGPAGVGPIQRFVRMEMADGSEIQVEITAVVRP